MNKKVFVVDDSSMTLQFFQHFSELISAEVVLFSSPEEAIQKINGDPISVIVSDVEMPGMDGFEMMRKILETHPGVPFFMMSGKPMYAQQAREMGAVDFFHKPFSMTVAMERIQGQING